MSFLIPREVNMSCDISHDEEFIVLFLENKKENSKHTARSYETEIKAFLTFIHFPRVKLNEVTFKIAIAYRESLHQQDPPYADSTIARKINIISSLYKFGLSIGYLAFNPFQAVIRPKVSIRSQNRYLTMEEIQKLLSVVKDHPRDYLMTIMLLTTGLRASELLKLRWSDIYQDSKGHIGIQVERKQKKKGVVKLRPDIWMHLKKFRSRCGLNEEIDGQDHSFLFVSKNNEPLSDRYLRKVLKKYAVKADIPKSISTHWLRHTSASLAINGGADIKTCMESYGWSHMQTAQRYIHQMNELEKTAVDYIKIDF